MSASLNFRDRLLAVLVPTRIQALGAIGLSLLILVVSHSQALVTRLGISQTALQTVEDQFHSHFSLVLQSQITSQLAVVTFWAVIGLVAYLLCWGAYNILIEARNEVTLNTAYTNRGHWRSPVYTLALKFVAACGLGVSIALLWYGLSFWIVLSSEFIYGPSLLTAAYAVGSVLGCALQFYVFLAFIQLTFMPWYRAETFTDVA